MSNSWVSGGDAGPALVMLHGVGGGGESWRAQLDAFAGRARCLAWNAPGYGGAAAVDPFEGGTLVDAGVLQGELA